MKKRITILTTIILIALAATGLSIYMNRPQQESPAVDESPDIAYTSVEEGVIVTQEDAEGRQAIEEFARKEALHYFRDAYSGNNGVTTDDLEWYFTDDNDSNNILVRASIVNHEKFLVSDMIVVQISTTEPLTVLEMYKPDDRYSL